MVYLTVYCQMPLDQHLLIKKHLQDRCVVLMRGCVKETSDAKIVVPFLYLKRGFASPHQWTFKNNIQFQNELMS